MASKGSEVIKSIHALAVLRHLDADPSQIGVIVKPLRADCYGATETHPLSNGEELAEVCHWEAQVRLKGGEWGCFTGTGPTPGEALRSLLRCYETSHEAVDSRRAGVLARRRDALMATDGRVNIPAAGDVPTGDVVKGAIEPTPEQAAFMKGYTAGARSMGELTDGVAAERAYHAQVALLEGLIEQVGGASTPKEAQLLIREARQALPTPGKK